MSRIFQAVPVLDPHDALGNHARRLAKLAGERHGGFIVERAHEDLAPITTVWTEAEVSADDLVVYHMALASQLGDWIMRLSCRAVLDYHNITPPHFFRAYDPGLASALAHSFFQLSDLSERIDIAVGHSRFSRDELLDLGYPDAVDLPVMIDLDSLREAGDEALGRRLESTKEAPGDVLFVGRLAPNKHQEDLIKAFAIYKRAYNPKARLYLVGGTNSSVYSEALERFVGKLGIEDVNFVGKVGHDQLLSYYRTADVFLSLSEHEGFGVSLVEAMFLGVPVVALARAAVPQTVGDGGVLLDERDLESTASIIDEIVSDRGGVRERLVAAGHTQADSFRPEVVEPSYTGLLERA